MASVTRLMPPTRLACAVSALAFVAAMAGTFATAEAQDFPAKPITLIIPFPAGGSTDIAGRVLAERMAISLKQPIIVDVDAFAIQNAYEANYHPAFSETVALLDIGASVMTINIVRGATSIFTRDISAGGNQYTDLLQKELDLTFEQAEALKRGATPDQQVSMDQIQPAIQSVSEMLALEIQRTLDFFRATAVDSPSIDRMLIAGGSSKVHQLTEYLSDKFQMPVERFDSFRSIKIDSKKFDDEYLRELSPNMAVAVGLAVRVSEVAI